MSEYINKLAEKYSIRWLKFTNLGKKKYLAVFDFTKSWWSVFVKRKLLFVVILSGIVLARIFSTLLPILIGYAISSMKPSSFTLLFAAGFVIESWRYYTVVLCSKFVAGIISGMRYSAYKFFLTVDPIYHSEASTGELFGKVERCSFAYEHLIDSAIYDILPIIIGMATVIVSFFIISWSFGILALVFIITLYLLSGGIVLFNGLAFEGKVIKADDAVKSYTMESLIQIPLIRSSFATNEVNKEIESKNRWFMAIDGTYYISFHTMIFLSRVFYALSVMILGWYIISMVKAGSLSFVKGTAFLVTYIHGTSHIIKIGKRVQKFVRSITRIEDLFSFIRDFGQKSFPVLKEDMTEKVELPTDDVISVQATDLYFAYDDAKIFADHKLNIIVPQAQENKMYGIIGPSGTGKTTFISILGGQLHPDHGHVEINEIPVYGINDNVRRKIIALQGQSASSLSGTLKDNLLLGVPKGMSLFNDAYMTHILHRVGIWEIFKEKGGLYSMIGEGGLNLSVGQRQRLNFASLYLRTKYYKPFLVMIDEPTSSLDEVSEQAITEMVHEIAENALVFVIAHRLGTLDQAVGILDFSLLDQEKDMVFYSRDELMKKSEFYHKLRTGEVAIEE